MKIISPSTEVNWSLSGAQMLELIEIAGRTAYKSEDKIDSESTHKFIKMIIARKHFSVLEHISVTARVICDRGVSHEIVRHRLASYTQESTRFCNYGKDKFGNELTFIQPAFLASIMSGAYPLYMQWTHAMSVAETCYFALLDSGATPQEARSVLPNSLKTEIVMTMNLREWRHFFTLRTASGAHPDMQVVAKDLLVKFQEHILVIFDSINE